MHDLAHFTLEDMSRLGSALRGGAEGARRMDEGARRVVQHLHEALRDGKSGDRACLSVRFFLTQRAEELPAELAPAASAADKQAKCLVLLAKTEPDPLTEDSVLPPGERALLLTESVAPPTLCALITQFDLDLGNVLAREPVYAGEASHKACNVFYTAEVPSVVAARGARSMLGFGGLLPSGHLFFVMLYLKTLVSPATAAMFRPIAINVKIPLLALDGRSAFAEAPAGSD